MQNSKVKEVTLVLAVNVVDNSVDEAREFDIQAKVESSVDTVKAFMEGVVKEKGTEVSLGSFNIHEYGNETIQPTGSLDSRKKLAVITAIYNFTDDVKRLYANPNEA